MPPVFALSWCLQTHCGISCCRIKSRCWLSGDSGIKFHPGSEGGASVAAGGCYSFSSLWQTDNRRLNSSNIISVVQQSKGFNSQKAVQETLRKSERTKNLINTKATDGNARTRLKRQASMYKWHARCYFCNLAYWVPLISRSVFLAWHYCHLLGAFYTGKYYLFKAESL